ncbi:energy transducer TonB [Psychromonas aquimarina]|uniref:energy transducer TonB n=1 Tax=Psychromonas aquimarina TaxID=444919 RepID=UPI00040614CC|nr:energy transducer TonB [Psychromonas aquimarina]
MNLQRYFIAGSLSLVLHTAMFWSAAENKAYAVPLGTTSTAVSLNFTSVKPPGSETKTAQAAPEKKAPIEKPQKKALEKKVTKKKTAEKKITKPKAAEQKTAKPAAPPVKSKEKTEPVETVKAEPKEKTQETKQESAPAPSGATEKPQLVEKPRFQSPPSPPRYPRLAKRKGIEGTVTYEVWLDEKGRQIKLTLKDSSGTQMLDAAALQAIEKWKFSPHKVNGQAIAQRVFVPIRFKLD